VSSRPFTLKQAYTEVDRLWAAALSKHGMKSPCCKGCSACCSEPVIAGIEEAKLIRGAIPPDQLEAVKTRTKEWHEKFSSSSVAETAVPHVMAYKAVNLPCPLLNGEGLCIVYKDRPLACRTHNALGPAALCSQDRMRQTYAQSKHIDVLTGALTLGSGKLVDHLGILLHRLLFDSRARSPAADMAKELGHVYQNVQFVTEV
jgi:Fe-S-cluster containining protein